MNKKSFLDAARHWDAGLVTSAVRDDPGLATYADRTGRTALHYCAATPVARAQRPVAGSLRTAKALLDAGADINAVRLIADGREQFPARPLWHAIARGCNTALAHFLLEQGSNPNDCLWAVIWARDLPMAQLLRSHGATLDGRFHEETPLLYATKLKRWELVTWLLENGAAVDTADGAGYGPLHYAVKRRYPRERIEELLRFGADPFLMAHDGQTPLSLAEQGGSKGLVALLRQARSEDRAPR